MSSPAPAASRLDPELLRRLAELALQRDPTGMHLNASEAAELKALNAPPAPPAATIGAWESPHEPTLSPSAQASMTNEDYRVRVQDMLANVLQSAFDPVKGRVTMEGQASRGMGMPPRLAAGRPRPSKAPKPPAAPSTFIDDPDLASLNYMETVRDALRNAPLVDTDFVAPGKAPKAKVASKPAAPAKPTIHEVRPDITDKVGNVVAPVESDVTAADVTPPPAKPAAAKPKPAAVPSSPIEAPNLLEASRELVGVHGKRPAKQSGSDALAAALASKPNLRYIPPSGPRVEKDFRGKEYTVEPWHGVSASEKKQMLKNKDLFDRILAGLPVKVTDFPAHLRGPRKSTEKLEGPSVQAYLKALGKDSEDVDPAAISWDAYNQRMNAPPGSRVGLKEKPPSTHLTVTIEPAGEGSYKLTNLKTGMVQEFTGPPKAAKAQAEWLHKQNSVPTPAAPIADQGPGVKAGEDYTLGFRPDPARLKGARIVKDKSGSHPWHVVDADGNPIELPTTTAGGGKMGALNFKSRQDAQSALGASMKGMTPAEATKGAGARPKAPGSQRSTSAANSPAWMQEYEWSAFVNNSHQTQRLANIKSEATRRLAQVAAEVFADPGAASIRGDIDPKYSGFGHFDLDTNTVKLPPFSPLDSLTHEIAHYKGLHDFPGQAVDYDPASPTPERRGYARIRGTQFAEVDPDIAEHTTANIDARAKYSPEEHQFQTARDALENNPKAIAILEQARDAIQRVKGERVSVTDDSVLDELVMTLLNSMQTSAPRGRKK